MPDFKFFLSLSWYFFISFFRYAWGTSDRKKLGTLDTLSLGQSKLGKASGVILECSTE